MSPDLPKACDSTRSVETVDMIDNNGAFTANLLKSLHTSCARSTLCTRLHVYSKRPRYAAVQPKVIRESSSQNTTSNAFRVDTQAYSPTTPCRHERSLSIHGDARPI